jgi:hypothetical protein
VQIATAQSKTGFFHGFGVSEASLFFIFSTTPAGAK